MNLSTKDIQMKANLGKILLLLFLPLLLVANAKQAEFSLTTNKSSAYVKEAIEISFVANQIDKTYMMFFFLEPKKSEDYEIELLNKKTTELGYHNYTTTFTYLLFPLKAKKIDVAFDFTIKVASDEAVAQVYQGSRDNTKWIETIDTKVELQPISIEVKKLEQKVDLVGEFQLSSQLLKSEISAYDSANITYKLTGTGYKDKNFQIIKKIPNTTLFSQQSDAFSLATKDGYKISREYTYALVSKESFTIPKVEIKAYSPKLQKYYTLVDDAHPIRVTKLDSSLLIDDVESPKRQKFNFELLQNSLIALLLFLSGFATAKLYPTLHLPKRKTKRFQDIEETKTAQELLFVLLQNYEKESKKYIDALELIEYKKSDKSFKEIKALILEEFGKKA